jgi:hypothetical protein
MAMETGAAAAALSDLRQHATSIIGQVGDYHSRYQQFEQTLEQRFAALQQAEQALLQHLQEERDRARQENQALLQVMRESTDWLHQSGTSLQTGSSDVSESLSTAEHGSETASTALQQAVQQLQQLAQKVQQGYQQTGQQMTEHVDQAHDKVHEEFVSGLGQMHDTVSSASDQHQQAIDRAFHNDFKTAQSDVHSHIEQIATQASQQLHERGDKLHQDVTHEVAGLAQHQDQHHQDLSSKLDQIKQELNQLGSTVTETAHGMADGVDTASLLLQQTNLGVQECLKIIQNVESIFQEIVGSYNS